MNWSYIAGFIDGEGWIGYVKNGYPRIAVTQQDMNVLEEIKQFVGYGKIYKNGSCYQLVWSDMISIFQVLFHVRYILIVKRDKAQSMYFDILDRMKKKNYTEKDLLETHILPKR